MDHNTNVWQCAALDRKLPQKVKNALERPGAAFVKRRLVKMGNFGYGLNVSRGIYLPHDGIPFPLSKRTWRGVAGTGWQYPSNPKYGEYQCFILCKESDICAPSDISPQATGLRMEEQQMILLVLFMSLNGEISVQISSIFYGIRIDSTLVSGINWPSGNGCWNCIWMITLIRWAISKSVMQNIGTTKFRSVFTL